MGELLGNLGLSDFLTSERMLGIARALCAHNPELRKPLKDAELLKRDPREHERMKYGLAKRRKAHQWTKR